MFTLSVDSEEDENNVIGRVSLTWCNKIAGPNVDVLTASDFGTGFTFDSHALTDIQFYCASVHQCGTVDPVVPPLKFITNPPASYSNCSKPYRVERSKHMCVCLADYLKPPIEGLKFINSSLFEPFLSELCLDGPWFTTYLHYGSDWVSARLSRRTCTCKSSTRWWDGVLHCDLKIKRTRGGCCLFRFCTSLDTQPWIQTML